jgi:hypothetical protein
MAGITYERFQEDSIKTILILVGIICFLIFKFIKGTFSIEYILMFVCSITSIFALRTFLVHSKKMIEDQSYRMSSITITYLNFILIICLGLLSLYIFAIKGVYGTYKLFSSFSWLLLIFRIVVIIASSILMLAVERIQDVLKWLTINTWNKLD